MRFYFGAIRWGRCRRCALLLVVSVYLTLILFSIFNFKTRVRYDSLETMYGDPVFTSYTDARRCRLELSALELQTLNISGSAPSFESIESANPEVQEGGRWSPSDCNAWQKVAIIVPYRDRLDHLKRLLNRLHPMLRKQKIYYQIFVVEQAGMGILNRGSLCNVGVIESLKVDSFDCFIFHDVDMLPEHDRNIYSCDAHARHLSSAIDEMRYHVMFYNYAGGVMAISRENVFKMNGYSNSYWGWGNEDDDFSARTEAIGLLLTRPVEHIGRYKMVRHAKNVRAGNGNNQFLSWRSRWQVDGLNSLDPRKYGLTVKMYRLYTLVTVDLGPPIPPPSSARINQTQESLFWFLLFYFP